MTFIKSFSLAVFLVIVSALPLSAKNNLNSAQQNFINTTDQALSQGNTNQIFAIFQKIDNGNTLQLGADWLRAKVFEQSDARLTYLYSTTLLRMSMLTLDCSTGKCKDIKNDLQESAVSMFFLGRLMLYVDGARCADKTIAYTTILYEMESGIGEEIMKIWQNYNHKHQQKIIDIVLDLEQKQQNRTPQIWICQRGLRAMHDYLDRDPECKGCTKEPSDIPGKMATVIPTNKINPELLSNQAWLAKREEIRKSFREIGKKNAKTN